MLDARGAGCFRRAWLSSDLFEDVAFQIFCTRFQTELFSVRPRLGALCVVWMPVLCLRCASEDFNVCRCSLAFILLTGLFAEQVFLI